MVQVVFFLILSLPYLAGVFGESVSVTEGDSVTLHTGFTELMDDDLIKWRFGNKDTLIVEINTITSSLFVYDDVLDGRFRHRLKVDHQTASLTIMNTTTEHAGDYKLQTNSLSKSFSLIVYNRLPVPVLIYNSSQCFSSVQYCSVLCSVVNVSAVSLSWNKGNSVLSSISVSDLSISLSLPLEVEYQDRNTYSCVINNTISNQTTHLDINTLCQPISQPCKEVPAVNRQPPVFQISAAVAGFLFVVAVVVLIFCLYRKYKKTDKAQENEITYADPKFYKRKAHKSNANKDDGVVYASVATRR